VLPASSPADLCPTAALHCCPCRLFYRLLSPAGISCYFQELLRRYSRLLTYEVAPPDKSWAPLDTGIINALKAHGVRDTAVDW
jgi:hypothetical protein